MSIKNTLFFLLIIILPFNGKTQVLEKAKYSNISSECETAVMVQVDKGVNCNYGYSLKELGKIKEVKCNNNTTHTQLHNTSWYLLNILRDGELVFEIAPFDTTNDYDFILFPYIDSTFCASLANNTIVPIRSNLSKNNFRNAGCTGLSSNAKSDYTNKSNVDPYSNSLPVKDGEKYILLIDNLTNGAGYTSYISFAKKVTINGTVSDATGVPLGLKVTLKDRVGHVVKQATSAADGSYSLSCNVSEDENYILVFESNTCFTETAIINTKDISPNTNTFSVSKSMKKLKMGATYDFAENVTELTSEFHRMPKQERTTNS